MIPLLFNITGRYINSKIVRNIPDKIIKQLIQHNIVVVLKDDPNQYLTIGNKQLKEDEIIAFTWNRYIHKSKMILLSFTYSCGNCYTTSDVSNTKPTTETSRKHKAFCEYRGLQSVNG